MVYTHSSHVCLLSTHMEVMFAYLPYLSMLTRSCLAQLCALYKSKTNKLQVLFAAVGGWTHFGEIQIKRFIYHPTSNISHGCSVRVLRFITSTSSYLHRQNQISSSQLAISITSTPERRLLAATLDRKRFNLSLNITKVKSYFQRVVQFISCVGEPHWAGMGTPFLARTVFAFRPAPSCLLCRPLTDTDVYLFISHNPLYKSLFCKHSPLVLLQYILGSRFINSSKYWK